VNESPDSESTALGRVLVIDDEPAGCRGCERALPLTGPLTAFTASWLLSADRADTEKPRESRRLPQLGVAFLMVLTVTLAVIVIRNASRAAAQPRRSQHLLLKELGRMSHEQILESAGQLEAENRLDEAIIAFWEAKRLAPEHGIAWRELAYLYTLRRWFALADREVERALGLLGPDSRTHYVAGVVKTWLGKHGEGETHLRESIRLDPGNADAREALETMFGK